MPGYRCRLSSLRSCRRWRSAGGSSLESWGHGYATEAATAALEQAFTTLGLAEVISLPQVDNPPSVRVAERLGMQLRRTVTAPATAKRGPVQVAVMSITCGEWEARERVTDRKEETPPEVPIWALFTRRATEFSDAPYAGQVRVQERKSPFTSRTKIKLASGSDSALGAALKGHYWEAPAVSLDYSACSARPQ